MSRPLRVPACTACGHAIWPPRPVCPRCGGREFASQPADTGVVEESTTHEQTRLGSIRTEAGPVVIARLHGELSSGAQVALSEDDAADGSVIVTAAPRS